MPPGFRWVPPRGRSVAGTIGGGRPLLAAREGTTPSSRRRVNRVAAPARPRRAPRSLLRPLGHGATILVRDRASRPRGRGRRLHEPTTGEWCREPHRRSRRDPRNAARDGRGPPRGGRLRRLRAPGRRVHVAARGQPGRPSPPVLRRPLLRVGDGLGGAPDLRGAPRALRREHLLPVRPVARVLGADARPGRHRVRPGLRDQPESDPRLQRDRRAVPGAGRLGRLPRRAG